MMGPMSSPASHWAVPDENEVRKRVRTVAVKQSRYELLSARAAALTHNRRRGCTELTGCTHQHAPTASV
jgi:Na+-transporting methylmalonyl-CoA/oxaloacetate decarboxylase gamma subunit